MILLVVTTSKSTFYLPLPWIPVTSGGYLLQVAIPDYRRVTRNESFFYQTSSSFKPYSS
jgi:hypothetical protein